MHWFFKDFLTGLSIFCTYLFIFQPSNYIFALTVLVQQKWIECPGNKANGEILKYFVLQNISIWSFFTHKVLVKCFNEAER